MTVNTYTKRNVNSSTEMPTENSLHLNQCFSVFFPSEPLCFGAIRLRTLRPKVNLTECNKHKKLKVKVTLEKVMKAQ
jgi:hypothetical protein